MLDALSAWTLAEACATAKTWPSSLRVSVLVSPSQLRSRALPARAALVLGETGLNPRRLEIQVTESALIDDQDLARHVLESLRQLGANVALDDFGAGFSSLSYLRRFAFDRIKIDRALLRGAPGEPDAAAILRAVLRMAMDLRLSVTAEGVETEEQMEFLREGGCAEAQGALVGPPMSAPAAVAFIENRENCSVA